jgi:hypothetical protein
MGAKPSDFFLGVIDFFGILVPGAVLLFLISYQHEWIGDNLGLNLDKTQGSTWILFFVVSYVLGQFLSSMSTPLNNLLRWFSPAAQDKYYIEIQESLPLPKDLPPPTGWVRRLFTAAINSLFNTEKRTAVFYRAFAFIRIKEKAAALAEIERQMAEYKLFRSLAVVFFIDVVLWLGGSHDHPYKAIWRGIIAHKITLSLALSILATLRFLHLLNWTYRIAFEHFALLRSDTGTAQAAAAGQNNTI